MRKGGAGTNGPHPEPVEGRTTAQLRSSPQTRLPSLPKKCSFSRRTNTGNWSPCRASARPCTRTTMRPPAAWQWRKLSAPTGSTPSTCARSCSAPSDAGSPRPHLAILGPEANRRGVGRNGGQRDRALQLAAAERQEVHRRRADEAGDEGRGRLLVDVERRAELLDLAGIHHHQHVGQRHRLQLVVGDIDRGDAETALQVLDLDAHLAAQLGVEVGQRLVEQEDLRIAHDGAAHGDALALAAGELARAALEQVLEFQRPGRRRDPAVDLVLRRAAVAQAVGHVVVDLHMRVERIVLEHHGDVALGRARSR